MLSRVRGQVVLVTGAAGGIGSAVARLFAGLGGRVVLTGRRGAALEAVALPPGSAPALRLEHDVADPAAWERVMARVLEAEGRLDVLVNCAGVVEPGRAAEQAPEQARRQVEVNLLGTVYGCRAALRAMLPRARGRIVNVASLGGVVPMPGEAVYCATKYAVRGYSFSLHAELAGTGVGVCVVSPDSVATPQLAHELRFEEAELSFVGTPLPPERVARAVLRATRTRRPEIVLPASTGALARLAMAFPGLVARLMPLLRAMGRRGAARRRAREAGGRP